MLAIKATHCFDGERFRTEGVTALIEGADIVGVEPLAYDPPEGVEVTTYDGTLLPGLIDCHVHLVADGSMGSLERAGSLPDEDLDAEIRRSLRSQGAAGVTTVRDLGDVRYRTLVARDRLEPGLPRVVAAGPPLTVPGGHCHYLGAEVAGAAAIRDAVLAHAERGVDVIKVMASGGMLTLGTDVFGVQFTAEEMAEVVGAGHAAGLRVVAHCHSEAGARHAVAAGVDGLEHATCLTEHGPSTPEDLFATIAQRDIAVDPTFGVDPSRIPPVDGMPPGFRLLVERHNLGPVELLEARIGQLARARELGVRVVSGLDAGAAPAKSHGGLWRAVTQLGDAGYTAAEALATATSVAADDCGLTDTTGRLAPGLAADLLVVDGGLSADLAALARPLGVWVRGVAN